MKAVIMAGGAGSRLRPLTCNLPKPMARLCGRPIIEYILELLSKNQITEGILTLQYLPQTIISHFEKEEYAGIKLIFCEEEIPLGTAGSVKNALWEIREPVLVISGDAMCDFPLVKAMEAHKKSGADVTIVTARVEDPREYGLVITDKEGRITGFIEKPSYSQAVSELANTGIYILSPSAVHMIPEREKYDFASQLFPKMLEKGMRLQSCTLEGYWCDIGDLKMYKQCQRDMLAGKVNCFIPGKRDSEGNIFAEKRPAGEYEIIPPVYFGEGVHIGEKSVIGPYTVLDQGAAICTGATAGSSVLLPRAILGERAGILDSVLCAGASVKSKATLLEGCAVGENAVIGSRAVVQTNVRIWKDAVVEDAEVVCEHITEKGKAANGFDEEGIRGEVGVELTPELAVKAGCAIGTLAKGKTVGIACNETRCSSVLKSAMIAGIRSTGANVMDFGCVFRSMFSFAMGYNALTVGSYIVSGEECAIRLVSGSGLPATRKMEREIEILLSRGEFSRCGRNGFGDLMDMSGIGVMYITELLRLAPEGLSGMSLNIACTNKAVQRIASDILTKLGCELGDGPTFILSDDGTWLCATQGNVSLNRYRTVAAYGLSLFEEGKDIAVENDFPQTLELLAQKYGQKVYRYLICPADNCDEQSRRLAAAQPFVRDGLMLLILLLDRMKKKNLTVEQLDCLLPDLEVEEKIVSVDVNPAKILNDLSQLPIRKQAAGEGVLVEDSKGIVHLRSLKRGKGIKIFAQAASSETAKELCADFTKILGGLLDNEHNKG
ncbi:sugar phosphate nucleotidyltransferase [Youxingia wuxianensis]|uniref:NTP transferase domain-containing protein n=1 Tax=Youxingia wuxianensis TaxID=2763678 RepID=A0A926ENI5_9FIRM|nr:sugar phosphate nucleotidyltransferase [Youxingia wuxianensis]MBC8584916.1 NTP transferase domain-containing protein [Youxingia wuxianensis]